METSAGFLNSNIWKHTTCGQGCFSSIVPSQLRRPTEFKFSQVCYFMHVEIHQVRRSNVSSAGLWRNITELVSASKTVDGSVSTLFTIIYINWQICRSLRLIGYMGHAKIVKDRLHNFCMASIQQGKEKKKRSLSDKLTFFLIKYDISIQTEIFLRMFSTTIIIRSCKYYVNLWF